MWLVYQLSRGEGPEKKTLRDKSRVTPGVPFGPVRPERAQALLDAYKGKIVQCVGPDDPAPLNPPPAPPPKVATGPVRPRSPLTRGRPQAPAPVPLQAPPLPVAPPSPPAPPPVAAPPIAVVPPPAPAVVQAPIVKETDNAS